MYHFITGPQRTFAWRHFLTLVFCLSAACLFGDVNPELVQDIFREGITVDLCEPNYTDGVLTTEQGGVITGPGIRIQARKITYIRKVIEGIPVCRIEAEGDLMLEFGESIFVGERLEYDFQQSLGLLYCGRTSVDPWFLGGEVVCLCPDGNYCVTHGYLTTSEGDEPDWLISADQVELIQERYLEAKDVKFRIMDIPFFWLPSLSLDLEAMDDRPNRYTIGWGAYRGRVSALPMRSCPKNAGRCI